MMDAETRANALFNVSNVKQFQSGFHKQLIKLICKNKTAYTFIKFVLVSCQFYFVLWNPVISYINCSWLAYS